MPNDLHNRAYSSHAGSLALQRTVAAYAGEICARRQQLADDLVSYRGKLDDLKQLDPLDFTGLQHLYTAHLNQIEQLLTDFDNGGA